MGTKQSEEKKKKSDKKDKRDKKTEKKREKVKKDEEKKARKEKEKKKEKKREKKRKALNEKEQDHKAVKINGIDKEKSISVGSLDDSQQAKFLRLMGAGKSKAKVTVTKDTGSFKNHREDLEKQFSQGIDMKNRGGRVGLGA